MPSNIAPADCNLESAALFCRYSGRLAIGEYRRDRAESLQRFQARSA